MQRQILLVEDEPGLALTLTDLLRAEGYEVDSARDGGAGLRRGLDGIYNAIILDLMLPVKDGFEVCAELRANHIDTPILMLTARTQVDDRVKGLKTGADDYLGKPFDPSELLARLEALLRRAAPKAAPLMRLDMDDLAIDFARCEARRGTETIPIGGKELQLLRYLEENRNRIVSRDELLKHVWNYGAGVSSRTVDVHMAWLRQKLEKTSERPRYLHTVRGSGYRFTP